MNCCISPDFFPKSFNKFAQAARKQKSENPILYICGLGASVGCERKSEHSTRRDENHKYRGLDSQTSSV